MRQVIALLAGALCACGSGMPREFSIVSITPAWITASETRTLTVELDTLPPFTVDYGQDSAQVSRRLEVRIGPQELDPGTYVGHNRFEVTVAPGLPVGVHEVWVRLEDGREAVRAEGFTVKKAITGFWLETLPDQVQEAPFDVTIHASGSDSEFFEGTVTVSINKGHFLLPGNTPTRSFRSGSFSAGVRTERVAIDTPGDNFVLTVEDDARNKANSNAFTVRPR